MPARAVDGSGGHDGAFGHLRRTVAPWAHVTVSTDLRGARSHAGPLALVVGGQVSIQSGAAVAALLFPRLGPLGVVSLRLVIAAVVLLVLCRPALRGRSRSTWAVALGFGVALAAMNSALYESIARIPLGAAVTIEVLGPLALSVVASRRASSWLWAAVALAGVVLLGRDGLTGDLDLVGVGFAVAAATAWAAYILLSQSAGRRFEGLDGLALAMTTAAILTLPLGLMSAGSGLLAPVALGLGALVALMSSLLPYSFDLLALHRLPASTFAVLMSLAPVTASLAGLVILGQTLSALTVLAIALVVVASAGAVLSSSRATAPAS